MLKNKNTSSVQGAFANNNIDNGSLLQPLVGNINSDSIYKDDGVSGINSPILKALIEKGINEEKVNVIKASEFKVLTREEANRQLEELVQFKSDITSLRKDDSIIKIINEDQSSVIELDGGEVLAKVQNSIKIFKDKNLKHDLEWEDIKRKLDQQLPECNIGDNDSLNLSDMKSINDTYLNNKEVIVDTLKKVKPLGDLGEITLNEVIVKGSEVLQNVPSLGVNNISSGVGSAFAGLSLFFMYKGVVKLFDSLAFKDYPKNISADKLVDYKKMRARELKTFMILGAPFIVGSLYVIKQVSLPTQVNVELESLSNTKVGTTTVESSVNTEGITRSLVGGGLISFIKNKLPNWIKYIFLITISFISLNYVFAKNDGLFSTTGVSNIHSIILNNLIWVKLFFVIGSISSFILICYYILNIYLYLMFSNNKITIKDCNIYLPQLILDKVKFIEKMSKYEDKGYYIEYYLRLIIVYLLIFLLCITIFIKLLGM